MSKKLCISFIKAGMYTTLQDQGRISHQYLGVPRGGALDLQAYQRANALVANEAHEPVLEITMMGPEILFSNACQIAITGASIKATVNGKEIALNRKQLIQPKDVLKFSNLEQGARGYLAINGKWEVDKWLESVSPVKNVFEKNIIQKGREIIIRNPLLIPNAIALKIPSKLQNIRWMPGPEYALVGAKKIQRFMRNPQRIESDSNRMGYRLFAEEILESDVKEIISSPVIPGTIQLLPSGQCILLMRDAQTIGGYPRIAIVLSEDLDKVAQFKPGELLYFKPRVNKFF